MSRRETLILAAAAALTALHVLDDATHHTGELETRPGQYEQRVVDFFDRHLLSRAS